jgi:NhaA family Na+:H+ antiporter
MGSDRFLARAVVRPVNRFLHIEASGGILLAAAAAIAVVWANSPWSASYRELWDTVLTLDLGGHAIGLDLRHWINDGLMALFFFVIGLEIRQELTDGQLASVRAAFVPAAGALGGMVVPALIYAAINLGGDGADGWGIPMATDVAFAVGVLALLGSRVPAALKVLLLGLAIVDDIGAIVVIAVFYSDGLDGWWGAAAAAGLLLVVVAQRVRVRFVPFYAVVGTVVWFATLEAGIHPTIAGVALGLLTPSRPLLPPVDADAVAGELSSDTDVTAGEVRDIAFRLREAVPVTERLQDLLHPWTSYVIVPLFALANAGVEISSETVEDAASSPVTLGVIAGLVLGKLVGVTGAMLLATRFGGGRLPDGVTTRHVVGMGGIAGIGFTVSIFVAGLAFEDEALVDQAKLGVLAASVLAAAAGSAVLLRAPRR